jgi:non-heme chloroperoxidase
MNNRFCIIGAMWLSLAFVPACLSAQQPSAWRDPSPHTIRFVTVDKNVKLEVLDWGGSGRPVVLLAGEGGTAHVFDDFAPKLTPAYHVYAITRRGYGASSAPGHGYSADRLGDDVVAVLDALKIEKPVLAGHSIAGEELSSVGSRHPEHVAGLVYLDAAWSYAYYDAAHGDLDIALNAVRSQMDLLQSGAGSQKQLTQQLLQTTIPAFEKALKKSQDEQANRPALPSPPPPTLADLASFDAYRAYQKRVLGWPRTEANLRDQFELTPDGHLGKSRLTPELHEAIMAGEQKFTGISVPVLAIFASPHDPGPYAHTDVKALAAFQSEDAAEVETQVKAVRAAVPQAHVVLLSNANHAIFLSNESDVLREMRAFVQSLG